MLKKNDILEVKIESDSGNGSGIFRCDGLCVFVNGTTAGDEVKVRIVNVKSSYAVAELLKVIKPSENRCYGFCKYSEKCGGCDLSYIKYERQLEIKKDHVLSCLERIGKLNLSEIEVFDTIGMANPWEYRNKMVFPVGYNKKGKIVGGFYQRASHEVVELKSCKQGPLVASEYMNKVLEYMKENSVPPYDEKKHRGLIRRVFVRMGFNSKEVMVVISANGRKLPKVDVLKEKLMKAKCGEYSLKSIILNVNKEKNNLVLGDENINIYGRDYIEDTLCGVTYKISANSFYQVNPVQTDVLYNKAMEFADLSGKETVIDLYCGIGTISLMAAKYSKKVIGVEIVEKAIEDAKMNAVENGIENAEFIAGSAETISVDLTKKGVKADVVFIDPPRKGSDEITLDCIVEMNPEKIVYVSCNPSTLARDLRYLEDKGYKVKMVQPVDMFPNTSHVETVVLLSRKIPDDRIEIDIDLDELDITTTESKATYEEIKAYVLNKYHFRVSSLYIAQIKTKYGIKEAINYNISKKGTRVPQCPPDKENAITDALKYYGMI